MAVYALTDNFNYFFKRLNPSPAFEKQAASEHATIRGLIVDPRGLASALSPTTFLQGSYKQETAIYTINDVDIVALCRLWYPGPGGGGKGWSRDEIFETIAAPLLADGRYKGKVYYHSQSMCVKVDLGIKVEILPVVYKASNNDPEKEPFCLYRPEKGVWEDGYARYHQRWLSYKNSTQQTFGNFIPAIKVLKHLRSRIVLGDDSFHIECLLYSLPNSVFAGGPADWIASVLRHIVSIPALTWVQQGIKTPCGERLLFTASEWNLETWSKFREAVKVWEQAATLASTAPDEQIAIKAWQLILGDDFFPSKVSV